MGVQEYNNLSKTGGGGSIHNSWRVQLFNISAVIRRKCSNNSIGNNKYMKYKSKGIALDT